jgi:peptide/nickel transport system substrate-binding protein
MRLRFIGKTIAIAAVGSLVAVACGGGEGPTATAPGQEPTETAVPQGGNIVVAAEQWPECTNPITSCSAATWYWWSVAQNVLPYAMQLDPEGNFIASPLLVEAPSLDNGGITQDPFTITFRINPDANWEDGSPITSADLDFTWKAILNTSGAYTTVGYDQIDSVDTSDPKTAVITFTDVFVDWPDLFGGVYQGILKKAAFPDADEDEPNLKDEMLDTVPFSGGPWVLDSWSNEQAVYSRNENYFGTPANLDGFTIVPRLDQATEINSLLTGEVSAIFPQPSDVSLIDQVAVNPNVKAVGAPGAYYEALYINHESAPMDDPAVREAFMYAIDRQSVIDAIIKLNNPDAKVLTCGYISFEGVGPWCDNKYFEFPYDAAKSRELLTAAGYDCSAEGQACTKDGNKLVVEYSTVATNTRRTTTQELLKEKATEAGFDFRIKNYDAGVLFGDIGPKGDFTIADYASGGSVDPSITSQLTCDVIPSRENDFGGGNWNRWCNQQADQLMLQSDTELDPAQRLTLLDQVYQLEEQDFLNVPLYQLPNVGAWRTDKVAGPLETFIPSNYGMFFNMHEWYIVE